MKKYLYDFEATEDGIVDSAEPITDADPGDEADVTPEELDDAAAALEPDYAAMFARPEFAAAIEGAVGNVFGNLAANVPAPQYEPEVTAPPEFDPDMMYDPGYLHAYLEARDRHNLEVHSQATAQVLQSMIGPYQETWQKQGQESWRESTDAYYDSLKPNVGEFDYDLARGVAAGAVELGLVAPEQAHDFAARKVADYVKAQRADAVEQYKKQLLNRDSTPYEPGVTGAGVHGEDAPKDEMAAAQRWVARNTAPTV